MRLRAILTARGRPPGQTDRRSLSLSPMSSHRFFATTPKGLESLFGAELAALGATELRETRAGVAFVGTLAIAYRACLWSRLANRVLLPLEEFPAPSPEALSAGEHANPWEG